ncbi:MAG: HNH endonuclease [Chloroflexi bacterium]|nr:HNH endonuclease [Chloroflexota bacterium]
MSEQRPKCECVELSAIRTETGSRGQPVEIIEYNGIRWGRYPTSPFRSANRYFSGRVNGKTELLHRQVYRDCVGPIPEGSHVHHIDGDEENNQPANLEVLTKGNHAKWHFPSGPEKRRTTNLPVRKVCPQCLWKFSVEYKLRKRKCFCSKECSNDFQRMRSCIVCGATYLKGRTQKRKTCSKECESELRSKGRREMHARKHKEGTYKRSYDCVMCGKPVTSPGAKTCSKECAYALRSKSGKTAWKARRLQSGD